MNNIKGFKRTLMIALVSISMIMLVACKQESKAQSMESKLINTAVLTHYGPAYATGVARIIIKQKLSIDDVSKIDFSLPGSDSYKKNPEMNIYAPEGGQIGALNYDSLNTVADSQEFIITLGNRVAGVGTEKTELLAILPNVKDFACTWLQKELERKGFSEAISVPEVDAINLSANLAEVAEDKIVTLPGYIPSAKGKQSGCVQSAGKYYYYYVLLER